MNKGLEALKVLVMSSTTIFNTKEQIDKSIKSIEKELEALEIIKKHPMFYLRDDSPKGTYRMYDCELYSHYDLTEEEYDLLKEVLNES